VSPLQAASPSVRNSPRRPGKAGLRRWQKHVRRARRKLGAAPAPLRLLAATAIALCLVAAANLVVQVFRKPTEVFLVFGGALKKTPTQTWQAYAPLFREHATPTVIPELLAALAQVEGAGDPVARTYWRWRLSMNPFAIYAPASSAVGMYQMTDAAFMDARRHCVRAHAVASDRCGLNFYSRVVPNHAIELTSVYLDRQVASILARTAQRTETPQQRQSLAAIVHLCGAGPASAYARRGFRLLPGERCGDHDVGVYLARIEAMKRTFQRLAAAQ
jgi:hypothetical protein